MAVLTPEGSLNGDVVQEAFPSIRPATPTAQHPGMKRPASGTPAGLTDQAEDEGESVSVRLSITIRQRVQAGGGYFDNNTVSQAGSPYQNATAQADAASDTFSAVPAEEEQESAPVKYRKSRKWALKVGLGTSLPFLPTARPSTPICR